LYEPLFSEELTVASGFGDSVGVEHDAVARLECGAAVGDRDGREHAEHGAEPSQLLRGNTGTGEQRCGMSGAADGRFPVAAGMAESEEGHSAETVCVVAEEHRVQRGEDLGRFGLVHRRGADGVTRESGDDGRLDAFALHVADGHDPVAGGDLEDVIEIATHLGAVAGGPVGSSDIEPGDRRRGWRDQGLLQRSGESDGSHLRGLGSFLGPEQLALVFAPVGRVEDRGADDHRPAGIRAFKHRVDEDRKTRPVGAHDVERDGSGAALHLEHGGVVGLVIDPPTGGKKLRESAPTDESLALVASQRQEGGVRLDDRAVGQRRHVPARGPLVQGVRIVVEQRVVEGDEGFLAVQFSHVRLIHWTKAAMARVVSSGALRFGQCPVASSSTSCASGRLSRT
jgi:hypothetical protein